MNRFRKLCNRIMLEFNHDYDILEDIGDGFKFMSETEYEDDRTVNYYWIITPDGKKHMLDAPNSVKKEDILAFVEFYKKHNRFPRRRDMPNEHDRITGLTKEKIMSIL